MVLSNYVLAFDGGVIDATNSPLAAKYANFTVDYGTVSGSGRIELTEGGAVVESTEVETTPETEEVPTEVEVVEKTNQMPIIIIALLAVIAVVAVVFVVKSKKKN